MPENSISAASVAEYRALRDLAGLGEFSEHASEVALRNTLHGVWLREGGDLVGMGRLIGDGACFAQVTDIAVHPAFQRMGLGTRIMAGLMTWASENLPSGCYISLIADPGAEHLYEKFGFSSRNGMARTLE